MHPQDTLYHPTNIHGGPCALGSGLDAGKSKSSKTQEVLIFRELAVSGSSHKLMTQEAREINGRAGRASGTGHRAAHALPLGSVSPQLPPASAILESRLVGQVFKRSQKSGYLCKIP